MGFRLVTEKIFNPPNFRGDLCVSNAQITSIVFKSEEFMMIDNLFGVWRISFAAIGLILSSTVYFIDSRAADFASATQVRADAEPFKVIRADQ